VAPCFRGSGVISVFSILYFLGILLAGTGPPPVMVHANICSHTAACVPAFYYVFVLILLYTCPHTTIYLSSHGARTLICVRILLYISICMCYYIFASGDWPTSSHGTRTLCISMCRHASILRLLVLGILLHQGLGRRDTSTY
jgi:hypothetical protein